MFTVGQKVYLRTFSPEWRRAEPVTVKALNTAATGRDDAPLVLCEYADGCQVYRDACDLRSECDWRGECLRDEAGAAAHHADYTKAAALLLEAAVAFECPAKSAAALSGATMYEDWAQQAALASPWNAWR